MSLDLNRLSAAKLWLISAPPPGTAASRQVDTPRDLPYLAHALYALVPIGCAEVPRMTVDERWRLYVNPDWLTAADIPTIGRELTHLVWHLLADHADRARSLDVDSSTARFWKDASDATTQATFAYDRLVPPEIKSASDLGQRPGLSAEEYYALLSHLPPPPEDGGSGMLAPDEGCGSGADGVPRSHELPPDAEASVDVPEANQIRRRVAIDFREHNKGRRGSLPGDAWRWTEEILEPRIPWEALLAGTVRRAVGWAAGRGDYTYSRPSRLANSVRGVVLPGMHRPIPRVAMVIDTSASVDDRLLERALGEVDGALLALGIPGSDIAVYSCDAAVHTVQKVRRARDAKLAGGGGTDMRVGLQKAAEQRPRPDVIVVFTDGDTPWPPEPPPRSAIVVALLGRAAEDLPPTPAWAVRVECLLD